MTARARLRLLALLSAALLAACATPPPAPREPAWTSGRLSVRIAADAGATDAGQAVQSMSAAFEMRGNGQSGELRLNSPLGTRLAQARWAPGLAVLETPEGEQRFDTLDELSRRALGEALPLAALPDWIAGRPWPAAPHRTQDGGFEQLGWQVLLARRAEGWIEARRDAPPEVVVRVRLDEDTRP
ncbi:MAG: outer membrane lipoprotein LolB [Rubrivivax sp.]|nr:outer membrane lipoprotein LolB [Rubrivivax sp.]